MLDEAGQSRPFCVVPESERPHASARITPGASTRGSAAVGVKTPSAARRVEAWSGRLQRHSRLVLLGLGVSGVLAPLLDAVYSSHTHQHRGWTIGASALVFVAAALVGFIFLTKLKTLTQWDLKSLVRKSVALPTQTLQANIPSTGTSLGARRARLHVWARGIGAFACGVLVVASALTTLSALIALVSDAQVWPFHGLRYFFGLVACAAALILSAPRFRKP